MRKNKRGTPEYSDYGEQHRFDIEIKGAIETFIICDGGKFHAKHWKEWRDDGFQKAKIEVIEHDHERNRTVTRALSAHY